MGMWPMCVRATAAGGGVVVVVRGREDDASKASRAPRLAASALPDPLFLDAFGSRARSGLRSTDSIVV